MEKDKEMNLNFMGTYYKIERPKTFKDMILSISQCTEIDFKDLQEFTFTYNLNENEEFLITEQNFDFFSESKPLTINMLIKEQEKERELQSKVPKNVVIGKIVGDIKMRRSRMSTQILNSNIENEPSGFSSEIEGIIRDKFKDFKKSLVTSIKMVTSNEEEQKGSLKRRRRINNCQHYLVICNGCNQNPLKGVRYSCAVCNYNYCEECESKYWESHKHPMYIFRYPVQ